MKAEDLVKILTDEHGPPKVITFQSIGVGFNNKEVIHQFCVSFIDMNGGINILPMTKDEAIQIANNLQFLIAQPIGVIQ